MASLLPSALTTLLPSGAYLSLGANILIYKPLSQGKLKVHELGREPALQTCAKYICFWALSVESSHCEKDLQTRTGDWFMKIVISYQN